MLFHPHIEDGQLVLNCAKCNLAKTEVTQSPKLKEVHCYSENIIYIQSHNLNHTMLFSTEDSISNFKDTIQTMVCITAIDQIYVAIY